VNITSNPNREHVTLVVAAVADGTSLPTHFVFKGKKRSQLLSDALPDGNYSMSESGYVNTEVWRSYVTKLLEQLPLPEKRGWICIVLDGYGCHVGDPKLLELLLDSKIVAVALPAHTSAVLQPLDVANFSPLKAYHRKEVLRKAVEEPGKFLSRHEFARHIQGPLAKALSPDNVKSGFRKAGLWPVNKDLVLPNSSFLPYRNFSPLGL